MIFESWTTNITKFNNNKRIEQLLNEREEGLQFYWPSNSIYHIVSSFESNFIDKNFWERWIYLFLDFFLFFSTTIKFILIKQTAEYLHMKWAIDSRTQLYLETNSNEGVENISIFLHHSLHSLFFFLSKILAYSPWFQNLSNSWTYFPSYHRAPKAQYNANGIIGMEKPFHQRRCDFDSKIVINHLRLEWRIQSDMYINR